MTFLAACGDDDDGAETATVDGREVTFCDAVFDLLSASNEDLGINPEEATEEEIAEASRRWYGSARAKELMAAAQQTSPDDLTDDVNTLVDGLQEFAATGDLEAAEAAIRPAQEAVDAHVEDECPEQP